MKKIKYFIIIFSFCLSTYKIFAQNIDICDCKGFDIIKEYDSISNGGNANPCALPEKKPRFPGGEKKLKRFIHSNSSYDVIYDMGLNKRNDIERVFVCLEFDKNGNIIIQKVLTRNEKYKADANKIIDSMPNWIPARQRKKNVSGCYIFMIPYKK